MMEGFTEFAFCWQQFKTDEDVRIFGQIPVASAYLVPKH